MEDFKWTDSLVKEFQIFYNKIPYAIIGIDPIKKGIEMFKESKDKKGYEVLLFSHEGRSYTLTENGKYNSKAYEYWNAKYSVLLNSMPQGAEILSVKRLSDDEIFSVGDKIGWGYAYNFETIIKGFKIEDGELVIIWDCDKSINLKVNFKEALKLHKKDKEVLFTTEDGVEIYEGCNYYHVCEDWSIANFHTCAEWIKYKNPPNKSFSTKEAAEDWILMNKPCLSVNDIIKQPCGYTIDLPNILKELAKSKI